MKKPHKCCKVGSHKHTVPMPINGRVKDIDFCLAPIVAALNAANIITVCSCCGHSKLPQTIILEDDVWLLVTDRAKALEFVKQNRLVDAT